MAKDENESGILWDQVRLGLVEALPCFMEVLKQMIWIVHLLVVIFFTSIGISLLVIHKKRSGIFYLIIAGLSLFFLVRIFLKYN